MKRSFYSLALLCAATLLTGYVLAHEAESPRTVLGIHHFTLKQGVSPEEFERFATEEVVPIYNERIPFARYMIAKGDRGGQVGQYISVIELNSVYLRDYFFPDEENLSEVYSQFVSDCGECQAVYDRFLEMTEETEYTDYVELH